MKSLIIFEIHLLSITERPRHRSFAVLVWSVVGTSTREKGGSYMKDDAIIYRNVNVDAFKQEEEDTLLI